MHVKPPSDLAIVTCYFNPCHFKARYNHYLTFAENIRSTGVKLVTVELAFGDDPFDLTPSEDTIQIRSSDVMFHKERLINIGINSLPPSYTKVGWFDCDIIFASKDWPGRLSLELDKYPLVQSFARVVELPAGFTQPTDGQSEMWGSAYHYRASGEYGYGRHGFAWAARREILGSDGLYDVRVVGDGDTFILMAAFLDENKIYWAKQIQRFETFRNLNLPSMKHFLQWAKQFSEKVRGQVGYLDETVYVLYHGEKTKRQYGQRGRLLRDFDPYQDLKIGEDGVWHWSSDKAEMHEQVRDYFASREEDGK